MKPRVCFFVHTKDQELIKRNEFYIIDIKILNELGFDVHICNSFKQLPSDVKFYFIWWWTYAIFPALKAKRLKIKSVITGTFNLARHVPGADYYSRPIYQKILINISTRLTDMNIMVSEFESNKIRELIPSAKVCYSPHVLDIEKYNIKETEERDQSIFTVAWMSDKNARRKCIPEIIKAAALLKKRGEKYSFLIAGKIEQDAEYLKTLAKNLNVSDTINFLGPINEKQKIQLIKKCGIYLQPTIFEGFGVAIAEALLSGAPVITSNVGAVDEVTNSHCSYVNGKDPEEIAKQIIKVFNDYDEYKRIALKGSQFIQKNYYLDRRKKDIEKILINLNIL